MIRTCVVFTAWNRTLLLVVRLKSHLRSKSRVDLVRRASWNGQGREKYVSVLVAPFLIATGYQTAEAKV